MDGECHPAFCARRQGVSLSDLEVANEAFRRACSTLVATVSIAHLNGASWQEIADVLGMSEQAARERFRHLFPNEGSSHGS